MDWLLITRSIKSQICYLLGDFKVGLILNRIWFPQIRENSLKHLVVWAILWETQGGFESCQWGWHQSQSLQRAVLSSWLPFFYLWTSLVANCQLFVGTNKRVGYSLPFSLLLCAPGSWLLLNITGLLCPMASGGFSQWEALAADLEVRGETRGVGIYSSGLFLSGHCGLAVSLYSSHCSF